MRVPIVELKSQYQAKAEKVASQRASAASAVDQAAADLAKAIAAHRALASRELDLRTEAGTERQLSGWAAMPTRYELALRFALSAHNVADVVESGPSAVRRPDPRPLAEQ